MKAYKDTINEICSGIHTGLVDFSEPRAKASMPTQASSEFITNKQQGDWA
ncbi:MAG: AccI family restriction endonuclease [Bacteroidaceae bacterium]|nr:AccI family restriction endonuclease [Bacteroidaceae bacterium]